MHVLIVNAHYSKGGASRAAKRLQNALQEANVKADYISFYGDKQNILENLRFNFKASVDRLPSLFFAKKKIMFSTAWLSNSKLLNIINSHPCDIVHLHWINSGALSLSDIAKIKKPIVWSMHDMWAFTGGCHYDNFCNRYTHGCGNCPLLNSTKKKDLSHNIISKKSKFLTRNKNITLVGLSAWMTESAKKSYLFKAHKIVNIPNPIDTNFFSKEDVCKSREAYDLPKGKILVLFGAMSALDDTRKGYRQLIQALSCSSAPKDVELVVFGSNRIERTYENGYAIHYVGYINNDMDLRKLYSAADVMIVPSLQENLSNAIMESLSCSTPVVAFDIGGNRDMIEHKHNGYLAEPQDPESLAKGISWVIDPKRYPSLCNFARDSIVAKFDNNVVATQYKNLYKTL